MDIKTQFRHASKWEEGNRVGVSALFTITSKLYSMNHQENLRVEADGSDLVRAIKNKISSLQKRNRDFDIKFNYLF